MQPSKYRLVLTKAPTANSYTAVVYRRGGGELQRDYFITKFWAKAWARRMARADQRNFTFKQEFPIDA